MNIQKLLQKCKSAEIYTALIIIVVGFGSFGLGRLSVLYEDKMPVRVQLENENSALVSIEAMAETDENPLPKTSDAEAIVDTSMGIVIASKSGSKYHYPWCSGALRISEKNKISFASIKDARAAGYTPATNCKGLK